MNKEEDNDDMGESSSMICIDHPLNKNSINPGGICAFCLQEKLGKLVSSSFPITIFPASSSSSSFRSADFTTAKKQFIPFLSNHHKNQQSSSSDLNQTIISLKRSKSASTTATQRKGFWSFLHNHSKTTKSSDSIVKYTDPDQSTSIDRKVSRSRSVGCGSRSFSGDFLERIGDCTTFRRVESTREGKSSSAKERVKCGGLFGGFAMTSSSSSSSSSSYRGWGFVSPLRALKKPSSKSRNLSGAIPPLLSGTNGGVYV